MIKTPQHVLSFRTACWLLAIDACFLATLTLLLTSGDRLVEHIDRSVAAWGYDATYGHGILSRWWIAVARYGQPMVLRVVLVSLSVLLAIKGGRAVAAWLVGIAVAENVIAPMTKYVLNRPRPHWLHPIAVEHSLSYPSGHAAAVGMFTTATVLVALMMLDTDGTKWFAIIAVTSSMAVFLTVSLDRIFLGVHYLSDVLGGNLLGAAIALGGWLILLASTREHDETLVGATANSRD